jgi:hypothetical protein
MHSFGLVRLCALPQLVGALFLASLSVACFSPSSPGKQDDSPSTTSPATRQLSTAPALTSVVIPRNVADPSASGSLSRHHKRAFRAAQGRYVGGGAAHRIEAQGAQLTVTGVTPSNVSPDRHRRSRLDQPSRPGRNPTPIKSSPFHLKTVFVGRDSGKNHASSGAYVVRSGELNLIHGSI